MQGPIYSADALASQVRRDIIDRMIQVPDPASIAAMRLLARRSGHQAGGSTGTNLWGAFAIIAELRASGVRGSVVTLLFDGGERVRPHLLRRRLASGPGQ
jgi:cysteine synthase